MNKLLAAIALVTLASQPSAAAPRKKPAKQRPDKQKPEKTTPEQKEADRHFKSGVALFKENKFSEALAEFERAFEIAPHPLVLYNIAGCHRELSHYGEAVKFYNRFLDEGKDKVPPARLAAAQSELDGILARIARITITTKPAEGVTLLVDNGAPPSTEMPLILPPGEHRFVGRAAGYKDTEKVVRVASGDDVTVALDLVELPPEPVKQDPIAVVEKPMKVVAAKPKKFALGAAYGTNLRDAGNTGVPAIGLRWAPTSRVELGVDGLLVAYAVMPQLRIRLAGDAVAVHLIGGGAVSIATDNMSETFWAGTAGLGLRLRATPMLAFRIETLASFAAKGHGVTVPTFLGGELWF